MSLYPDYDPHQEKVIRELERAHGWLMQRLSRILLIGLAVIVVLWFASGVYMVNQGHVGVVRTFWQRNRPRRARSSLPLPLALSAHGFR